MMYRPSVKFHIIIGILFLIQNVHLAVSQDCTLPEELWGTWTSTNLGTIVITGSSPSLTFSVLFTAQNVTANEMDCRFTSGTQYILESKVQVYTFSSTNPIFMWMCLDLRRASAYSYYYYLNSPIEVGFDGYRLVGLPDSTTTASDVCTTTLDTAEFHTMIKVGHETDAVNAVQCADAVLGSYSYTYTDSTGTFCENANASTINACDNANKTHILVNNSDCTTVDPFYSTEGSLGCIANVYDSSADVYYISLYNLDSGSPTPQFICTAATQASNGTVYLSTKQTDCESGQTPTVRPTGGATMVLSPSCPDSQSKKRNWIWLIILLPCLVLLITFIIASLCLYSWLKKRETRRARKKKALAGADHPLGEMSMKLDAPASLGMQHGYIDRKRDLLEKPTRRRMSEDREDLFGEQSLDLNLETETWMNLERGRRPPVTENGFSGAIVNGSVANGSVTKPKASNSISGRFKSMTKNFLTTRMAANNLKTRTKSQNPKSYERSTQSSSSRGPLLNMRNGVHPESSLKSTGKLASSRSGSRAESLAASRPASRAVSRTGSRRGSIDNLVIARTAPRSVSRAGSRRGITNNLITSRTAPRSVSRTGSRRGSVENIVTSRTSIKDGLPRSKTMVLAKAKEEKRPAIYTMPEEYVTDGGPNEVMPSRPAPATGDILRETYQSINRRSLTHTSLKKPMASKKPWH